MVAITEGIPVLDMVRATAFLHQTVAEPRLVGGNCPGLVSPPEKAKVGIIPNHIVTPGRIGVVSRSGTLTYEILAGLKNADLGVSTCVGIGGDPVLGLTFKDVLGLFASDPETEAVVMLGEIGGSDEEAAAALIASGYPKPVFGFIAGRNAPPGKRMGHAGAIISGNTGTPQGRWTRSTRPAYRWPTPSRTWWGWCGRRRPPEHSARLHRRAARHSRPGSGPDRVGGQAPRGRVGREAPVPL